ncbi:MAG TPA: hypothetical protein PK388_03670 [Kiritimatiellia bacterium]|nr:hypothetical protein [Kiritimatiellia bacterium]
MKKSLLRLVVVGGVAIGGLAAVVWAVSRDAAPPDETEFAAVRPEVAPEDNAFTYFLEATNLLVDTTNDALFVDFRMGQAPASDELRERVAQNAECLALVKRGTECAICLAPPVETIDTPTPYVTPWLHMIRILEARSRLARLDGRFAEAADDLAVGMRFGDLVQKNASSLITYLVGVAIFSSSVESALELARDPAVSPEPLAQLAAELEKTGPFGDGLVLAIQSEQRIACNLINDLQERQKQRSLAAHLGFDTNRWTAWMQYTAYSFQPNRTKQAMAVVHHRLIANTTRIYADRIWDDSDEDGLGRFALLFPNVFGKYLLSILVPGLDKLTNTRCRTDGILAGTKLVVACNRFQRDKGNWPDNLQDVVPNYLPEVPRDPYDGAPFRYSAEEGLVWAAGTNLTDEGGSTRVPGSEQEYVASRDRRRAEDCVFELRAPEKTE